MVKIAIQHMRYFGGDCGEWLLPPGAVSCRYEIDLGAGVVEDLEVAIGDDDARALWWRVVVRALIVLDKSAEWRRAFYAVNSIEPVERFMVREIPIYEPAHTPWRQVVIDTNAPMPFDLRGEPCEPASTEPQIGAVKGAARP